MKNFHLFKYIRQWKYAIVVLAVFAALFSYKYISGQQVYTAETVLIFADGEKAQPEELLTPSVISAALERSGHSDVSPDYIRLHTSITSIIPKEEEDKKDSMIKLGEEYEYFPTDYKVVLKVDSSKSRHFAGEVLEALITEYCDYYVDNRSNMQIPANNAKNLLIYQKNIGGDSNVSTTNYDFLESIDLLEDNVDEIITFLNDRAESNASFRSTTTGYTFRDLIEEYQYELNNSISVMHSEIMDNKLSKNTETLLKNYKNKLDEASTERDAIQLKVDSTYKIIQTYTNKVNDGRLVYDSADKTSNSMEYVLPDVYGEWGENDNSVDRTTVYDDILQEYVGYRITLAQKNRKIEQLQNVLDTFSNGPTYSSGDAVNTLLAQLDESVDHINTIYDNMQNTLYEYYAYSGQNDVRGGSSVYAVATVNVKLYAALIFVVFIIFGCIGAIVLGRLVDFWDYVVLTDKKTLLPNRNAIDRYIANWKRKVLPIHFSVMIVHFDNLKEINQAHGRERGDQALLSVANSLKSAFSRDDFLGYNGQEYYLAFCEAPTSTQMKDNLQIFEHVFSEQTTLYNLESVKLQKAILECSSENIFDINKLLSAAYSRVKIDKEKEMDDFEQPQN